MYKKVRITTTEQFAKQIGLPMSFLNEVLRAKHLHFRHIQVPRKDGQPPRDCVVPSPIAKRVLRRINRFLQTEIDHPTYIHAGLKSRSIMTNAREHAQATALLKIDIRKFFPSTTTELIRNSLEKHVGLFPAPARDIAELLTFEGALVTGSPASTLMASLAIRHATERIHGAVIKRGGRMTVYVDDIAISGGPHLLELESDCIRWIEDCGVKVHTGKLFRLAGSATKIVTGVEVTHGLDAPKGFRRQVQATEAKLIAHLRDHGWLPPEWKISYQGTLTHLANLNAGMAATYRKRAKRHGLV